MTNCSIVVPRLSWPDVWGRRLDRHGLSAPVRGGRPADAVAAMCGAHAQVLSAAEVSIGLRIAGATRNDVRDALWNERSLVKTFGPRGTEHCYRRVNCHCGPARSARCHLLRTACPPTCG
jgi:hypothetical protein